MRIAKPEIAEKPRQLGRRRDGVVGLEAAGIIAHVRAGEDVKGESAADGRRSLRHVSFVITNGTLASALISLYHSLNMLARFEAPFLVPAVWMKL